ncbi:R3H domain-containing nucleic acid-binding protein [Micromonospora sp. NPDC049679]|uniref:Jag family protein n=1 Tax=Micromonospora sp. NPDC049679 TaxID=3155920 RepID=UPI00340B00A0
MGEPEDVPAGIGDLPPAPGNQRTVQVRPSEYGDETVTDTSLPSAEQSLDEENAPTTVVVQDDDSDVEETATEPAGKTDSDLFRQSEIAADYIEGLLDILDYDGDIDELVSAGRPVVEVVGGGLQALVGQRGATLEALQELTRLAVFRQTGTPSRLLLDVGGYRANRRKELAAVAKNAVEKVKEYGEPVRLEPMSAFERKCVHDVINALTGVESESEGVEPNRRIIVRPVD